MQGLTCQRCRSWPDTRQYRQLHAMTDVVKSPSGKRQTCSTSLSTSRTEDHRQSICNSKSCTLPGYCTGLRRYCPREALLHAFYYLLGPFPPERRIALHIYSAWPPPFLICCSQPLDKYRLRHPKPPLNRHLFTGSSSTCKMSTRCLRITVPLCGYSISINRASAPIRRQYVASFSNVIGCCHLAQCNLVS